MWQVIRQAQGLSPNKSGVEELNKVERFEFNRERLLLHEVRSFIPHINKCVYTKCYNSLRFEKLRRWLIDEDINIRIQALDEVLKLFSERRENCVESLCYDFLTILLTMLCSESEYVQARLRAATILEIELKERSAQLKFLEMENEVVNLNCSSLCDRLLCVLTFENEAISFSTNKCVDKFQHFNSVIHQYDSNDDADDDDGNNKNSNTDDSKNNTNGKESNNFIKMNKWSCNKYMTCADINNGRNECQRILPNDGEMSKSTIYYQLEQKRDLFAMVLRVIIACHSRFNNFEITQIFVRHKAIGCLLKLLITYQCRKECVDDENNQILLATICATFIPLFDVKESVLEFIELDGVRLISDMLRECSVCEKNKAYCCTSEKQLKNYEELRNSDETCDKSNAGLETKNTSSMLIAHVAEVLSRVCECVRGRRAAFEARTCEVLFPFIHHENLTVRVEVHAALAQLTVLKENKEIIVSQPQYLSTIKKVLECEDERDVLMFFVKTITNLAELPCARSTLRKMCLERLHIILSLSGDDKTLQTAINVALSLLENVHECIKKNLN